jgi:hypothetical protein
MKKLNEYDVLAVVVIVSITIVLLIRNQLFPVFVDIYYHSSVAVSFEKAGGIVLWDFWEFAPEGRPHLYPPLLHSIMLLLSEVAGHMTVAKFISFVMFPASQVTLWWASREIFSRKTAFYALLILSSSLFYFKLQAVTSAAALVLVLVPVIFYAFEKGKYIASGILLALCLYTHVGMGPIALCSFGLYCVLRRERLKEAAKAIVLSLVLFLPLGIHLMANMESLSANSPPSAGSLMVFPWILGIIGALICVRRKKEFLIPVCILVCMIPIAFSYWGRFMGHSILPLAMLSGVTLSHIDEKLSGNQRAAFVVGALVVLSLVAPTFGAQTERRNIQQSGMQQPGGQQSPPQRPQRRLTLTVASLLVSLPTMPSDSYMTPDNVEMAEIIRNNSQENEIVFIPGGIMGCFVTATTGRPQLFGMWQEVEADYEPDPKSASVFVASKGRNVPEELIKIGETTRWTVYRVPQKKTVEIPDATVGKGVVYLVLLAALAGIVVDFFRKKR